MKNEDALKFFRNMSEINKSAESVKLACASNFADYDVEFIKKYVSPNSNILDLGSGTGLIVNKLIAHVEHITAVEPIVNFTNHIKPNKNIEIVTQTILEYATSKQFDLVTIFAVMHYFNEDEAIAVYKKYLEYLKQSGIIIIKNQFGVNNDVIVSGYSEEQKTNYYAHYRHIDKEVKILKTIGFKNIEVTDIYPLECNRWENTHFYAITAEKSGKTH